MSYSKRLRRTSRSTAVTFCCMLADDKVSSSIGSWPQQGTRNTQKTACVIANDYVIILHSWSCVATSRHPSDHFPVWCANQRDEEFLCASRVGCWPSTGHLRHREGTNQYQRPKIRKKSYGRKNRALVSLLIKESKKGWLRLHKMVLLHSKLR